MVQIDLHFSEVRGDEQEEGLLRRRAYYTYMLYVHILGVSWFGVSFVGVLGHVFEFHSIVL